MIVEWDDDSIAVVRTSNDMVHYDIGVGGSSISSDHRQSSSSFVVIVDRLLDLAGRNSK